MSETSEASALLDIAEILKLLALPAAIKIEMIGHRIAWHEAHESEDWDAAWTHFDALTELQTLYSAKPVTTA